MSIKNLLNGIKSAFNNFTTRRKEKQREKLEKKLEKLNKELQQNKEQIKEPEEPETEEQEAEEQETEEQGETVPWDRSGVEITESDELDDLMYQWIYNHQVIKDIDEHDNLSENYGKYLASQYTAGQKVQEAWMKYRNKLTDNQVRQLISAIDSTNFDSDNMADFTATADRIYMILTGEGLPDDGVFDEIAPYGFREEISNSGFDKLLK